MEYLAQKILYQFVKDNLTPIRQSTILRNLHLTIDELNKSIISLLELNLIIRYKEGKKVLYKLSEVGKYQYKTHLSEELNLKLKLESYTK